MKQTIHLLSLSVTVILLFVLAVFYLKPDDRLKESDEIKGYLLVTSTSPQFFVCGEEQRHLNRYEVDNFARIKDKHMALIKQQRIPIYYELTGQITYSKRRDTDAIRFPDILIIHDVKVAMVGENLLCPYPNELSAMGFDPTSESTL